jgi:hypothetical protein
MFLPKLVKMIVQQQLWLCCENANINEKNGFWVILKKQIATSNMYA